MRLIMHKFQSKISEWNNFVVGRNKVCWKKGISQTATISIYILYKCECLTYIDFHYSNTIASFMLNLLHHTEP